MRDIVHTYVRKFREERRERRKFLGVLLCLALAVAGGIMWQFKTTGIAYTNEAQCGIEEHTHSDDCYAWVLTGETSSEETVVLEETQDAEAVVVETAAVENAAEESLTASDSEAAAEAETQDAAAETADVTSQAAESDESADAAAADTAAENETAAASETVSAASTESTTVVTSEETLHTQVLLADATETEDWYLSHGYEKVLVCGKEEHIHTIECLSDETADLETAEVWEASLPSLTGVWADDVVAIAESQIGYAESTLNFTLSEDGTTRKGYTRYGAWYGNVYGDWDAMFAAFCLHYAGVSESDFPVNSGAYAWSVSLKEAGLYQAADSYTPATGDLAFLDKDQDGTVDTVAVIIDVNDTTLTVVEGNSNDAVEENSYEISDGVVAGYGVLPEQNSDVEVYTASANGVTVTVTAPTGALPEDAILSVTLYEEDSDEYAAAAETIGYEPETAEVVATEDGIALASEDDTETETVATSGLAVLDICFVVDGVEVEPSETVTVSIDASAIIPEEADASTIEVQHLTENENGEVEAVLVADATEETAGTVTVDAEEATAVAEFEVGSFSNFTITWYSTTTYDPWGGTSSTVVDTTVYVYDTKGNDIADASGTSFTFSDKYSDKTEFTEIVADVVVVPDGYNYSYATVEYTSGNGNNQTTNKIEDAYAFELSTSTDGRGNTSYTLKVYSDSEDTTGTSITLGNNTTVTIYLYYENTNPQVEISASSSSVDGPYTLSASTSYFPEDATVSMTWTFTATDGSNNSLTVTANDDGSYTVSNSNGNTVATITKNSNGTYTVTWNTDNASMGYTITATVSATDGSSTATDSYTLTYSGASTTTGSTSTTFDHVDVKVTLAESENSTTNYILYKVSSVSVTYNGSTTTATSSTTNDNVSGGEWTFFHNNNQQGQSSTTVSYAYDATITIVYTLKDADTGATKEYTAVLTKDSTYASGTYYPADGENAYKLYNYLYGTNYSESKWASSSNYGNINISGMSIFLVASILCDGSSVSYGSVGSGSMGSVGLDFALDVATLMQNTANFNMDVQKVFEGSNSIAANQFTFNIYDVTENTTVTDNTWKVSDLGTPVSESTVGSSDSSGTTTENVEFDQITYSSLFASSSTPTSGTETKTYYYIITETNSGETGVTYDGTIYGVVVTVTTTRTTSGSTTVDTTTVSTVKYYKLVDNGDGSYTATEVSINTGEGVATSDGEVIFTFTNSIANTQGFTILKVDNESSVALTGAEFTLTTSNGVTTYYNKNGEAKDNETVLTVTSASGLTITGLAAGTYTLTEVTAPDGYNLLNGTITLIVNSSGVTADYNGSDSNTVKVDTESGKIIVTITNIAGTVLPSTGGTGTYLYTLAGLLLILSAVCLMYKNLRRKGDLPY